MTVRIETDVLIVGSGPAGGSMALTLATYGIDNLVITRFGRLVRTPRAHITNQRAMEVLRDLGVEEQVVEDATPKEWMGNNVFCETLAGDELGRIYSWQMHPQSEAEANVVAAATEGHRSSAPRPGDCTAL